MIHLDALTCAREETLMHGVHSHRHIVTRWVPVTVRSCRLRGVGLGFHPCLLAVFLNHRTTALTAHLQSDAVGVRAVRRMAVEAASRHDGLHQDGIFVESAEVALIDPDVTTHLIAGLDAPIGQSPLVETVVAHVNRKILILLPLAVLLHTDRHRQCAALILSRQLLPVVDIEISPRTVGMDFSALRASDGHIHSINILIGEVEVQRRDIRRNRHPDIVGIDLRLLINLSRILW